MTFTNKKNNRQRLHLFAGSILAMLLAFCLNACEDTQNRYTRAYACVFHVDLNLHSESTLLRNVLNNPTSFVIVDVTLDPRRWHHLMVSSNNGKDQEEIIITTEKENRSIGLVGAHQSLIIGCSINTFDNDHGWRAYDRQCPACLDNYNGVHYPLNWVNGNTMQVACAKCKRVYELNYGTSLSDDGYRLLEYIVALNGNVLSVSPQR